MNPTQVNPRGCLEQAIDAEIKSLEESLIVFKLRRNALQPISSLPPEIFANIFSFLCLPGIPSLGGKPSRNRVRFDISHVCHQWREIALNQPLLWSHINFNTVSLAGAAEILARAQLLPLYMETRVSDQYDCDQFGQFLKLVQSRLPRISHLSISAEPRLARTIYRELESALVSPAPTLEYLSLFSHNLGENMEHRHSFIGYGGEIQKFGTLFGDSAPRLSCLKLLNCAISWNPPLFKGLNSLEIVTRNYMDRPTLAVWLDTLDEMPRLKTLTLHSASPFVHHFPFDVQRMVTLPSLTHLDISADLDECALASAHLVLPALISLRLTAIDHSTDGRVQAFLPYVARHFHGPQDIWPLQSMFIRSHGYCLELLGWPVPDIDTFVHDPPAFLGATLPTRVNISFNNDDVNRIKVFETLMAALPLDGLMTLAAVDLQLVDGDITMKQVWLNLLPNWPLLQHVRLVATTTLCGFITALLEGRKTPLLPSLTSLALDGTAIGKDCTLHLRDALVKRVEQGVPLETLDLSIRSNPRVLVEEVRLLSEVVSNVLYPV